MEGDNVGRAGVQGALKRRGITKGQDYSKGVETFGCGNRRSDARCV